VNDNPDDNVDSTRPTLMGLTSYQNGTRGTFILQPKHPVDGSDRYT
jgi:hypothetical protein